MRPSSLSLRSDLAAASLLLALSLLYFRAGLGPGDQVLSHAGGDTRATFFYWRHFAARHIADGVVPLWNPYIFCGMPFIASLYAALFYPPNVVFLLLPTAAAINASIILHNFLAGVFMCALGRGLGMSRWGALASAVVFMFGAPHALHVFPGHLDALCTMAWTPLAFLVVEKWCATAHWRFVPLGGLVLGVQILAGQMQYFYYSCIGVSLYFVWRAVSESLSASGSAGFSLPPAPREQTDPPVADGTPELGTSRRLGTCGRLTLAAKLAAGFGLMMALGVLCAAPQFLPALEMSRLSARQHLSYDFCASFSLPPENLITFLMPTFFGDMVRLPYWGKCYFWEMTAYVGILPLALALLAVRGRKAWPFVALASVAVILALGKHTPVFAFLHGYAPGFKLFRGTSKFIFIALLALAALSGLGLDALLGQRQSTPSRRIRTLGLALLASCAVCLLVFTVLLSVDGGRLSWWRLMLYGEASVERYDEAAITMLKSDEIKQSSFAHARGNLLRLGILFGASGLVVLRPRKSLALALILGDLFWFGARLVPTFE
ncbi:MAG: hypothetical protein FJ278_15995, partial [Planctomycetes bacterium]|nr:hypothetical protein [Planctomycetota bacterium]